MKRILLLALVAAFCIPGKCFASPRASAHTDTIRISNITTTHISFSSEIKYVDLSSRVLAAKIVDGRRDIIALKAREPFDFTTTMSCLEANGAMHTFLVQFEEYPKELVIEAGSRTVGFEGQAGMMSQSPLQVPPLSKLPLPSQRAFITSAPATTVSPSSATTSSSKMT